MFKHAGGEFDAIDDAFLEEISPTPAYLCSVLVNRSNLACEERYQLNGGELSRDFFSG